MADVGALRDLYAFMSEVGATYARVGDVELRLESPPPRAFVGQDAPPPDPDEDERRSLETLLHSAGGDAGVFLAAMKKIRSAA